MRGAQSAATSSTAMAAIVAAPVAMAALWRSDTAIKALQANATAWKTFTGASSSVMGKTVAILAGLNPSSYADMTAIAASSTAMAAIIANATALNAVATSSTAMAAIIANATALNAVVTSSTAMAAIHRKRDGAQCGSDFLYRYGGDPEIADRSQCNRCIEHGYG